MVDEYHHRMGAAAADFRRDLEDLVCDHLGGCYSPPPSFFSSKSESGRPSPYGSHPPPARPQSSPISYLPLAPAPQLPVSHPLDGPLPAPFLSHPHPSSFSLTHP